jgi:Rhodanese-like domain
MTMTLCSHLNQVTLAFVGATGGMAMRLISARELKERLDRGDPLKLVNALGDWEYRAAHIPGSLHFSTPEETLREPGRWTLAMTSSGRRGHRPLPVVNGPDRSSGSVHAGGP